jgi:hypothetical protein
MWSAYFREAYYGNTNPDSISFRFAKIYYDRTGQRIRIKEYEEKVDGNEEGVEELFLFQERVRYRVLRGSPCVKEPLTTEFRPFDVPYFGAYLGINVLGFGPSTLYSLNVDHFRVQDESGRFKSYQSWAPLDTRAYYCVPVYLSFAEEEGPFPGKYNSNMQIFNISTAVSSVDFERPPQCAP